MNFKITITSSQLQKKVIQFNNDIVIQIQQREHEHTFSDSILKVKCLIRPDNFLQSRCCIYDKVNKYDLSFNHIIQTNPIKDKTHWLSIPDGVLVSKLKRTPDQNKAHRTKISKMRKKKGIVYE